MARSEDGQRLRSRLVALAVHDLRNPLASILGNAEYLGQALELSEDSREAVTDLLHSAQLFAQILAELRAINRGLDGEIAVNPARADLGMVVAEALHAASERARRAGVRLGCTTRGELWARADRELVRHVLDDLLDCALRNSASGGSVDIVASAGGGEVSISVRDRRAALPELTRIFELDGDGVAAGRRLALVFCRLACEAQGGRIAAAPAEGGGLVTTVSLPVAG